jgi:hypothetical protein
MTSTLAARLGIPDSLAGRYRWLSRAAKLAGAYAAWVWASRLLALTLVTYVVVSTSPHAAGTPRFEEVTDAFANGEVTLMGLAALLFTGCLRWLNPLTSTTTAEIFTPERFEKSVLPGFLQGAVLACGLILAFLMSGLFRYLGLFVQFDEAPLALASVALRAAALGTLAYCEEFLFRGKILKHLRPPKATLPGDLAAVTLTALIYVGIKLIQFDLGFMSAFTLLLLSLSLGVRALSDGDFGRGAGFWAALLIVFQPLLSLPVLGGDFSGLMLVKFQPVPDLGGAGGAHAELVRLVSGGAGGPLASFVVQLVLAIDVARGVFRYRKDLVR